ncbi:hypothetical protein [Thermoleptolyngbya sp. C42_A2020_037]|uniref:hypothetical protein n=1 Tax=Thermoleptolyngbya sp. C42_A2020_037 TaxID=2747799 RepID=UPI0019FF629A|nr:hypothetical protein [Thermoleptolyngbya sp. C42_A2020_037]MBF2086570.1 hypothetical protein [Thermoleptolyngbya sp. C42_A2020_037]
MRTSRQIALPSTCITHSNHFSSPPILLTQLAILPNSVLDRCHPAQCTAPFHPFHNVSSLPLSSRAGTRSAQANDSPEARQFAPGQLASAVGR